MVSGQRCVCGGKDGYCAVLGRTGFVSDCIRWRDKGDSVGIPDTPMGNHGCVGVCGVWAAGCFGLFVVTRGKSRGKKCLTCFICDGGVDYYGRGAVTGYSRSYTECVLRNVSKLEPVWRRTAVRAVDLRGDDCGLVCADQPASVVLRSVDT